MRFALDLGSPFGRAIERFFRRIECGEMIDDLPRPPWVQKATRSHEQANSSRTPEMVAKPYGCFLPRDKAARAALSLNRIWEAA